MLAEEAHVVEARRCHRQRGAQSSSRRREVVAVVGGHPGVGQGQPLAPPVAEPPAAARIRSKSPTAPGSRRCRSRRSRASRPRRRRSPGPERPAARRPRAPGRSGCSASRIAPAAHRLVAGVHQVVAAPAPTPRPAGNGRPAPRTGPGAGRRAALDRRGHAPVQGRPPRRADVALDDLAHDVVGEAVVVLGVAAAAAPGRPPPARPGSRPRAAPPPPRAAPAGPLARPPPPSPGARGRLGQRRHALADALGHVPRHASAPRGRLRVGAPGRSSRRRTAHRRCAGAPAPGAPPGARRHVGGTRYIAVGAVRAAQSSNWRHSSAVSGGSARWVTSPACAQSARAVARTSSGRTSVSR